MANYKKYFIISVLITACLLCTVVALFYANYQNAQELVFLQEQYNTKDFEVKSWKNKYNEYCYETEVALLYYDRSDDSLRKVMKTLSTKSLQGSTQIKLVHKVDTHIVLKDSLVYINDTSYLDSAKTFKYTDNWLDLFGYIHDTIVYVSYVEKSDINIDTYWKDKHTLNILLRTDNPHINVASLRSFQVQSPKPKWYQKRGFVFAMGALAGAGAIITPIFLLK